MWQPGELVWLHEPDGGEGDAVLGCACRAEPTGSAAVWRDVQSKAALESASEAGRRPWLDGVRIVDLTNVIAGPTIAGTLARFGAEVVKVDAPKPGFDPWNTVVFGMHANRGKRSLLVDLKTADGTEILQRLVRNADVITANVLDSQRAELGLDPARLHTLNPRLVLCQLDAWGGPRRGPRSDFPGYDDLVQAATGIMARFGGSLDTPEEHAHFGTIEVLAGYCGAFATALALLHRARTGSGSLARTSLAAAGQIVQLPFMYDYEGRPPFDEPSGRDALGSGPLYRCYQSADGWFFLAAGPDRRDAVAALTAVSQANEPGGEPSDEQLEQRLAEMFRGQGTAHWTDLLNELGVAVQPITSLAAVRAESQTSATPDALTIWFDGQPNHPSGYHVELVAPCAVRPRRALLCEVAPAPKYGSATRAILRDLGYSETRIDQLTRAGTAAEFWSEEYLPS